jgi:catechol 2,3-dioxygenase-like lactoylglutathione lyase family enzyme
MAEYICGIQQVGIGTGKLESDWKWYRDVFGMDIKIFVDEAEAPLMTRYTGDKVQNRVAALAMNMQGGGGFEIWQYKSRVPQPASFTLQLGDLGFNAVKMKTRDATKAYKSYKEKGLKLLTELKENPAGSLHFYVADTNGYWFEVVESPSFFKAEKSPSGGVFGTVTGVSDMEASIAFYRDLLGYDVMLSDTSGIPQDLQNLPGSDREFRRVILEQSNLTVGPFNPLLGKSQIELIQLKDGQGRKIFENRFWGDLGFIHLCYDVRNMSGLKEKAAKLGYEFTVDSADSFDMGKAAGRFSYVEDPDGTLIEFVETHKLPIVEKWGWYMNLQKRDQSKSLPNWMLGFFKFNRIRD